VIVRNGATCGSWALRFRATGNLAGRFHAGAQREEDGLTAPCLLFRTRSQAREFLSPRQARERTRGDGWRYWLDAHVVRVDVAVQVR
jgi:hypothetical protein